MKSTKLATALTTGWVWIYNHLIQNPQAVVDLYEQEVDDINNALQCCGYDGCGEIFMAENIICPACFEPDTVEPVFAPGQEATDFQGKREGDGELTPDVSQHLAWADRPGYITFGMKVGEKVLTECAEDCAGTLKAAMCWSLKQTSKLLNTARLEYAPSDFAEDIEVYVKELNDEFQVLKQVEVQLANTVPVTREQYDAIEAGAKFCEQHGLIFDCEEICPECHHQELLAENPELAAGEEVLRQAVIRDQKMVVARGQLS